VITYLHNDLEKLGFNFFLDEESPLPKVTNQHNHYETITGGPGFMNELLIIDQVKNR